MHRVYLSFGTGIGRPPMTVKSTLIANTDTCLTKAFRMSSYSFNGAGSLDVTIFSDIKVIADPIKSPPVVAHFKACFRETPVRPGGGTVDHNQANLPH